MTGKELKEFAALVCDDAEIQIKNMGRLFANEWAELQARDLRALHVVKAANEVQEAAS